MSPPMRQSVAQISAELGIHVVTHHGTTEQRPALPESLMALASGDYESICLGSTQKGDATIWVLTVGAGLGWLGCRLPLPEIQPVAECFEESHGSGKS